MIHIARSKADIATALTADFIADKQPLRDYAGFEPGSQYEGSARQTFSLVLSPNTINSIHRIITPLYAHLIDACWPKDKVLPFDMVRFDAFLNTAGDGLEIIELNTRNVGLHEIVEWLDEVTAEKLSVKPTRSLNKNFVTNQKLLHSSQFGENAPLLYMTKPMIPSWKYYDELRAEYGSVCHVTSPDEYEVSPTGLVVKGVLYNAIARKFPWPAGTELERLNSAGAIGILQPLWMRRFGYKDYLPVFNSSDILQSEPFTPADINDYVVRKESLVLKVIDSGGAKSVYLGPKYSDEQWKRFLLVASRNPGMWTMQHYAAPSKHEIIVHGKGYRSAPIQLGIFILPNPSAPHEFSLDIVLKAYGGVEEHFTFDPSGLNPDIWFGNVIVPEE